MSFELSGSLFRAELMCREAVRFLKQSARAINQLDLVEALGIRHFWLIVVSFTLLATVAASAANRLSRNVIETFNVHF